MQLRFALETDPAFQKEGIAIDAVEVMESPLHQDGRISVYPNPVTQGAFRLEWGSQRNQDLHIILRDLAGRKVFERQIPSREGRNRQLIQTSQFAPGLYLLHLEIGDYRGSHKLIYL